MPAVHLYKHARRRGIVRTAPPYRLHRSAPNPCSPPIVCSDPCTGTLIRSALHLIHQWLAPPAWGGGIVRPIV